MGQPLPPAAPATPLRTPGTQPPPRSSSPNYFGFVSDPAVDTHDSGEGPARTNWSSSSVVSFGDASKPVPLSANPEFESFRRQTEAYNGFNLSRGSLAGLLSTPAASRPASLDQRSAGSPAPEHPSTSMPKHHDRSNPFAKPEGDFDWNRDSAYASSDSKRASEASANSPSFFDMPMRESPASIPALPSQMPRNTMFHRDDVPPRLSLPQHRVGSWSPPLNGPQPLQNTKAETAPVPLEDGLGFIGPAQLKEMLDQLPDSEYLLLDLRVFPQFSQSRIRGALNLCIPTTLLKRPSFNLQRLRETFTNEAERERFARWNQVNSIVVYDASSSTKKDATSGINMLKKFTNEGWKGNCYMLRGGFTAFAESYPQLVEQPSDSEAKSSKINLSLGPAGHDASQIAGGCVLPATKSAANPFFSNIRQNQDLIGGVGQIEIKIPREMSTEDQRLLPRWLSSIAAKEDHGKKASDKFLHLELDEQSRMTKALSCGVNYGNVDPNVVQIAGIEKGGKNRYNNIWPFEHARVKLQGRPEGACDYVNASHIKASRSNKRYIASQGPLPDTFEVGLSSCLFHPWISLLSKRCVVTNFIAGFLECNLGSRREGNCHAYG